MLVPTQPTACNVVRRFEENIAVPTSLVGLFALASTLGGRTLSGWLFSLETFNGEHTIQSWLSFSGARFHEVQIWHKGLLWGELIKPAATHSIEEMVVEAQALVDDNIANPPRPCGCMTR